MLSIDLERKRIGDLGLMDGDDRDRELQRDDDIFPHGNGINSTKIPQKMELIPIEVLALRRRERGQWIEDEVGGRGYGHSNFRFCPSILPLLCRSGRLGW